MSPNRSFSAIAVLLSALAVLMPVQASAQTTSVPTITTQPAASIAAVGKTATFSVVAIGTPAPTYQWFKDGRPIFGATAATYTIASVQSSSAGLYTVMAANSAGRVTSNPAALSVNVQSGTLTVAPQSQTVNAGANVTFSVITTGTGLTYQWKNGGQPVSAATSATLTVSNVGTNMDGPYTVTISNGTGVAAIGVASLTVNANARLTSLSTRSYVGTGDQILIVGLATQGSATKKILLRGVGPTLDTQFGVANVLAKPQLTLRGFSRGGPINESNSGWGGSATLAAAFTQVGAFPLPAGSADAALLETLDSGLYTAQVGGVNGATGVALAEIYDADTGTPASEMISISSRAFVDSTSSNTLIVGFAVTGTTSDTVLVRGAGPSLGSLFGLHGALGAPQVTIFDSAGKQIAVNSGWEDGSSGGADINDANNRTGAFQFPARSRDSALVVTLAPGTYTAHVTGVNGSSGIALAEIYEVR